MELGAPIASGGGGGRVNVGGRVELAVGVHFGADRRLGRPISCSRIARGEHARMFLNRFFLFLFLFLVLCFHFFCFFLILFNFVSFNSKILKIVQMFEIGLCFQNLFTILKIVQTFKKYSHLLKMTAAFGNCMKF